MCSRFIAVVKNLTNLISKTKWLWLGCHLSWFHVELIFALHPKAADCAEYRSQVGQWAIWPYACLIFVETSACFNRNPTAITPGSRFYIGYIQYEALVNHGDCEGTSYEYSSSSDSDSHCGYTVFFHKLKNEPSSILYGDLSKFKWYPDVPNIILNGAFVTGEYEELASTIVEVCNSLFIQYPEYVVYHICLGAKNG